MTPVLHYAGPALAASTDNPLVSFSDTPWWLHAIKALVLFVYMMLSVVIVIWFERRVIGFMQQRPGPNRFGPIGIFQTLADGVKLILKEDPTPKNADKIMFTLAPIMAGTLAFITFGVIPLGPTVNMFGYETPLQLTDTPIAVLLALAVAGVAAYGFVLAGWGSGSTYPLLGGLRSTAQVISYEIAMGLSLAAVFFYSGSMSTSQIVYAQEDLWFILPAFVSFVIYVITMVGETNRLPFDLAEGEGELGGGYHTEYSAMRFGMFFLGEYINMFTVSALATTLFLGGWMAPPGIGAINDGMFNEGYWGILWFTGKMWLFMFFFVWLRGSLPRVRYDQFMHFGWKVLIPVGLAWVTAVAFIRAAQNGYLGEDRQQSLIWVFAAFSVVVGIGLWVSYRRESRKEREKAELESVPEEIDPFAGGYPVPPMPGQRLIEPQPALSGGAASETVTSEASAPTKTESTTETRREDDRG